MISRSANSSPSTIMTARLSVSTSAALRPAQNVVKQNADGGHGQIDGDDLHESEDRQRDEGHIAELLRQHSAQAADDQGLNRVEVEGDDQGGDGNGRQQTAAQQIKPQQNQRDNRQRAKLRQPLYRVEALGAGGSNQPVDRAESNRRQRQQIVGVMVALAVDGAHDVEGDQRAEHIRGDQQRQRRDQYGDDRNQKGQRVIERRQGRR